MEERRTVPRQRTLKGGHIVFNGGASTITCTIRNRSDTGAKLAVETISGIPDHFDIMIDSDNTKRTCTVIWRTYTMLGVVFDP